MTQYPHKAAFASSQDAAGAQLSAGERHALLEEIGHVALTLGQALCTAPLATPLDPSLASPALSASARSAPSNQYAAIAMPPEPNVITASPTSLSRPEALTSPLERLHFLTALWPRLEGAFHAIVRQPDCQTAAHNQTVLLARSRGGALTTHAVARDPRLAAVWQRLQTTDRAEGAAAPSAQTAQRRNETAQASRVLITERAQTLTVNTWGNRLAVTLLMQIEEEAVLLGRLAAFCDAPLETAMAARLVEASRRLRTRTFLRDCHALSEHEAGGANSAEHALRHAPPYRVLYQGWTGLHRPLDFDWTRSPLLTLPALEPWHLYEIWCLLQVGAALRCAGWQLVGSSLLRSTPRGLRLTLAAGRASRLEFRRELGKDKGKQRRRKTGVSSSQEALFLYYQPLFASANQVRVNHDRDHDEAREDDEDTEDATPASSDRNSLAFCSRSHAMQPDIVLCRNARLYVLDPKFKIYVTHEDAQEDVNKMHAYRDAIVPRKRGSANRLSAVESAWCLFPGSAPDARPDGTQSAAVLAYPVASPQHPYGTAGVGALRLRPGQPDNQARLAAFLSFLLPL